MRSQAIVLTVVLASLLSLLAGCEASNSKKVRATYRPEADFKSYKTYSWSESSIRTTDSWLDKQNLDAMIRELVDQRMKQKGYELRRDSFLNEPDFTVLYEANQFNQGELTLRVIDTRLRRIVWTGTIGSMIQAGDNLAKRESSLTGGVTKLLDQFPPQPVEGAYPAVTATARRTQQRNGNEAVTVVPGPLSVEGGRPGTVPADPNDEAAIVVPPDGDEAAIPPSDDDATNDDTDATPTDDANGASTADDALDAATED